MKNIHLLATVKPSRLQLQMNGNFHIENGQTVSLRSYQHIYITSDEDIKEGDWCIEYDDADKKWLNPYKPTNKSWDMVSKANYCRLRGTVKKIILTTDQDLINNVQSIDDEFLEWFVKNPSCEEVEVMNVPDFIYGTKHSCYKIIIPKEEPMIKCELCKRYPRLEGTNKCESCYSVVRHVLEQDPKFKDTLLPDLRKKQETLEEITEQIQKDCHKFVESIISKVTYQDATNTFLFMKLAELTLKLKKYE